MYLVQLLLPLLDNDGEPLPRERFDRVRAELTERFGGVTAHVRSPAQGVWKEEGGAVVRDEIVVYEVMAEHLERDGWAGFRDEQRRAFRQEELVVRAHPVEML